MVAASMEDTLIRLLLKGALWNVGSRLLWCASYDSWKRDGKRIVRSNRH